MVLFEINYVSHTIVTLVGSITKKLSHENGTGQSEEENLVCIGIPYLTEQCSTNFSKESEIATVVFLAGIPLPHGP
jgi:hypothetical protein